MDAEKIFVPRTHLYVSSRIAPEQSRYAVENDPILHRAYTEALHAIKAEAHKQTALLANRPTVKITVYVEQDAFVFPPEARDVYEAERVGQALGMEVRPDVEHLVVARLAPRILGDTVGDARDTDRKD